MTRLLWTITMLGLLGISGTACADDNKNEKKPAKEAFLGVGVESVSSAMRSQLPNLPEGQGVLVDRVAKDSPASKAGLQAHDILTSFNDQKLASPEQLVKVVRSAAPGQTAAVGYLRAGKSATCKVTLGEMQNRNENQGQNQHETERPNVFRFHPDQNFQEFFGEFSARNGEEAWSSFEGMNLARLDDKHWSAEITFRNKDGKKETKKFTGTREELRKAIEGEKDMPANEQNHLLRALNLRPPMFEFVFPFEQTPANSRQDP